MEEMMSFNFLAANPRVKYVHYSRGGIIMIKSQCEHLHLGKMGKNAPAARTLDFTNLDHPRLNMSSGENILLMKLVAYTFVKNDQKPSFSARCFFKDTPSPFSANCTFDCRKKGHRKFPTFAISRFHDSAYQKHKNISRSIYSLFVRTMRLVDYDARYKVKKREAKADMQEKRVVEKV